MVPSDTTHGVVNGEQNKRVGVDLDWVWFYVEKEDMTERKKCFFRQF